MFFLFFLILNSTSLFVITHNIYIFFILLPPLFFTFNSFLNFFSLLYFSIFSFSFLLFFLLSVQISSFHSFVISFSFDSSLFRFSHDYSLLFLFFNSPRPQLPRLSLFFVLYFIFFSSPTEISSRSLANLPSPSSQFGFLVSVEIFTSISHNEHQTKSAH